MLDGLLELIVEFVLRCLFYPAGWVFLKLVTLGQWSPRESWLSGKPGSEWVTALGAAVWVVGGLVALNQFVF